MKKTPLSGAARRGLSGRRRDRRQRRRRRLTCRRGGASSLTASRWIPTDPPGEHQPERGAVRLPGRPIDGSNGHRAATSRARSRRPTTSPRCSTRQGRHGPHDRDRRRLRAARTSRTDLKIFNQDLRPAERQLPQGRSAGRAGVRHQRRRTRSAGPRRPRSTCSGPTRSRRAPRSCWSRPRATRTPTSSRPRSTPSTTTSATSSRRASARPRSASTRRSASARAPDVRQGQEPGLDRLRLVGRLRRGPVRLRRRRRRAGRRARPRPTRS